VERGTGNITSLAVFMGHIFIFKRRAVYCLPSGQLASSHIVPISREVGAISHWTVKEIPTEGYQGLAFVAEDTIRAVLPTSASGGFQVVSVGDSVGPLIEQRYTTSPQATWADYNKGRAEYWVQYGQTQAVPQRGLIMNTARSWKNLRWSRHTIANLTAGCAWRSTASAETQVVGTTAGQVLQMHSGYTWISSAYASRLQTPSYSQGAPHVLKEYNRSFVDVETRGNYPVRVSMNLGRRGLPVPAGTSRSLTVDDSEGWGVGEWGEARWGGSGVAGEYVRFSQCGRGAYVQMLISTVGPEQWFKCKGFIIEAEPGSDSIDEA
jgi:hypothetical protein